MIPPSRVVCESHVGTLVMYRLGFSQITARSLEYVANFLKRSLQLKCFDVSALRAQLPTDSLTAEQSVTSDKSKRQSNLGSPRNISQHLINW